ncbi:phage tail sheath family protein [Nostoc sp. FACHB-87]|uniref:phage tail sheath family protein n=1 Tax=Nostocaceae TaxID=1162 RepID=UPI0016854C35|nr:MULTISPECIES: phage tail sheath subtilisin-like domain-containing protein [Nostocaceae]MBD2455426.1 phage tail sheath family protein [Nostoc sp. FACHB-87]MBD2475826.1 phage tail sheath family protein [Anabaena sp. FACHB-83]
MPITPTYPGVYIEEIPSGVRTITGVATSVTAFIGRALRGPVNEPVTINSFGDFERIFGGLWIESTLSYAVRDFYLNGGSQAIIVRLYHKDSGKPEATPPESAKPHTAKLTVKGLTLEAVDPGSWGNYLQARIDHDVPKDKEAQQLLGVNQADLFNLTIKDTKTGVTERFRNLTVKDSPRRVDKVLANESQLVRGGESLPSTVPTAHSNADESSKVADADQASDGLPLAKADFTPDGAENNKEGLYALKKADLFNLLCIPPYQPDVDIESDLIGEAAKFCEDHRAFLIVDSPKSWQTKDTAKSGIDSIGTNSNHAAIFFPRLKQPNPLRNNQIEEFAPCGAVAGIFARTDAQRGVWKAPAGLEATLVGVPQLSVSLTDAENGELNPLGINCLRTLPAAGRVIWGARTLQGNDRLASEWKYIPVRRLALYIEESLYRGTQWVVFEPNDEPLWAQIRLNLGAFMHNLFRQGAFQGKSPREAYFVKCDRETTTQNDINLGIVKIVVGFAPLKPAEFVIIQLQQIAGQIQA